MKKDFFLLAGLTLVFLALGRLPAAPAIAAGRRLAFYFLHPTAGNLIATCRHSAALGAGWRDLLRARLELEALRARLRRRQWEDLEQELDQDQAALEKEALAAAARFRSEFAGRKLRGLAGTVAYRPAGAAQWCARACLEPAGGAAWPEEPRRAVLQLAPSLSQFALAGQTLPRSEWFGDAPCVSLVTAGAFSLAVELESTGAAALLRGMNDPRRLRLDYLPLDAEIRAGDRVVTSAASRLAPPGIPVGEVLEAGPSGPSAPFQTAWVRPYADVSRLRELVVLDSNEK
jgi:hypothetical protein